MRVVDEVLPKCSDVDMEEEGGGDNEEVKGQSGMARDVLGEGVGESEYGLVRANTGSQDHGDPVPSRRATDEHVIVAQTLESGCSEYGKEEYDSERYHLWWVSWMSAGSIVISLTVCQNRFSCTNSPSSLGKTSTLASSCRRNSSP